MISSLGWGTFLLWGKLPREILQYMIDADYFSGIFDAVIAVLAFAFLKETRGLSLEAIARQRFKADSASDNTADTTKDVFAEHHEG